MQTSMYISIHIYFFMYFKVFCECALFKIDQLSNVLKKIFKENLVATCCTFLLRKLWNWNPCNNCRCFLNIFWHPERTHFWRVLIYRKPYVAQYKFLSPSTWTYKRVAYKERAYDDKDTQLNWQYLHKILLWTTAK